MLESYFEGWKKGQKPWRREHAGMSDSPKSLYHNFLGCWSTLGRHTESGLRSLSSTPSLRLRNKRPKSSINSKCINTAVDVYEWAKWLTRETARQVLAFFVARHLTAMSRSKSARSVTFAISQSARLPPITAL